MSRIHTIDTSAYNTTQDVEEVRASFKGEQALREFIEPQRIDMLKSDAAGVVQALSTLLPEVDKQAMLQNPAVGQEIVDSFHEGLKHSADGWIDDSLLFIEPWGFDFAEIKVPVFLWQGSVDLMVPFSHGQWLAEHLPQDKVVPHLLQDEGHVSIFLGRAEEMVDELLTTHSK